MITKDEIEEAAKANTYDALKFAKWYDPEVMLKRAFEDGVDWYKVELWHYCHEEPEEDREVLCVDIDNKFILVEADADWKQKVGIYEILKWCYLNDLL